MLSIFQQAERHSKRIAICESNTTYTYRDVLSASQQLAATLLQEKSDLAEARVVFLVNPGFDYVKTLWAIWQAGGVAVPVFLQAPPASIQYSLEDTRAAIMVVAAEYQTRVEGLCTQLGIRLIVLSNTPQTTNANLPSVDAARRAMILYTSGTTGSPKGVVTTHGNIEAQITTLVNAWAWNPSDHTLCVLPLHHVHGIINVIGCSLWVGARCEFIPEFSASAVFQVFSRKQVNVFMAVPTIYFKLIAHWDSLPPSEQNSITETLSAFRLMVCGSAALPVSVMDKWFIVSQHRLLERYGMTEIGMAISNPYDGDRKAGFVGQALPGVQVRLCDDLNKPVRSEPGEIQVKGNNVFLEYWQRPTETAAAFTSDGWFSTGDVAEQDADGYYKILGRKSQDIIKSGGYKISALEIEEVIRQHPAIQDVSVVGLPDDEWGERISAAIIVKHAIDESDLVDWLRTRLSKYKMPRRFLVVNELPRNAMGKVVKNELKKLFT